MTRPAERSASRGRIPELGEEQPPAAVVDAYWMIVDLAAYGWVPKRLEFDAHTATAFVTAAAPTRRIVTVSWDLRGDRAARQQVPGRAVSRRLIDLARAVASLGQNDAETGDEWLSQLCWLAQLHVRPAHRHHDHWRRSDPLPILSAQEQPRTRGRCAAWLIARLVGEYGWHVSDIGEEDVAGGGFVADIPGDVQAIFPATMEYDGTAAAALARMLPTLPCEDLYLLRDMDYRALWAAGRGGGDRS
ncbi:hypothetical protein [Mycobacterium avium]|uniref:Uncharacterized protein n=1 Tax=Mycobacterium avium subsp. hominissuis TaxID=439334 RepID=A0AAI8SSG8_MYCAV|nr:hypothetical protein [Mycobacterium avium]PBA08500.1 hypothetical protein CKJ70_25985 [Mycobacterium avium]BBN50795.1 hypothetical protein JPH1_52700 [Mycobacterium avium subsp. hominissuis]